MQDYNAAVAENLQCDSIRDIKSLAPYSLFSFVIDWLSGAVGGIFVHAVDLDFCAHKEQ